MSVTGLDVVPALKDGDQDEDERVQSDQRCYDSDDMLGPTRRNRRDAVDERQNRKLCEAGCQGKQDLLGKAASLLISIMAASGWGAYETFKSGTANSGRMSQM